MHQNGIPVIDLPVTIAAESANDLFVAAAYQVLRSGTPAAPRGMRTQEVLGAVMQLTSPQSRFVCLPPSRILNPAFAVAEVIWILSGSNAQWIFDYNSRLRQFADDGVLQGAYGVRMRHWGSHAVDQLARVVELLQEDPDTRRAVIQLYDPTKDAGGHRDVPCTLSYRFHLRDGRLHMSTTMRSQDVWLGLPYDLFSATVLHELVAGWLGADIGTYRLQVDSLHLYEENLGEAGELTGPVVLNTAARCDWELSDLRVGFDDLPEVLDCVLVGRALGHPGWDQFGATLHSYRLWKSGDRDGARQVAHDIGGPMSWYLDAWYRKLSGEPYGDFGRVGG